MTTSSEARPAATVVVLRPADAGFEVLLVRRNDRVAFMAGAFVFPGGRVDAGDRVAAGAGPDLSRSASRFPDLTGAEELAYRRAAVRELQEEAAVSVEIDALIPIAHWVTPEVEIRRYDTRFFLTVMPPGQDAKHDEGETTELAWRRPAEALEWCRHGEIMLPPPTWTTLRLLEPHPSLESALEWARTVAIVRVQPKLVEEDGARVLTLPGDPSFPAIPGWVGPGETRFLLAEGRGWLPVRP